MQPMSHLFDIFWQLQELNSKKRKCPRIISTKGESKQLWALDWFPIWPNTIIGIEVKEAILNQAESMIWAAIRKQTLLNSSRVKQLSNQLEVLQTEHGLELARVRFSHNLFQTVSGLGHF